MFDTNLNRQFIFNAIHNRNNRDQSHALSLHQQFVTVTASITYKKNNKKYYMIRHKDIELIAHPSELESY